VRLIDLMHLGRPRVIGCWQVDDVLVDPGPTSTLQMLLEGLRRRRPRALLLTHIHLDHAGASGSLVQMWPRLEVYVHERGAPHLIDPERLLTSAQRLYGQDMDMLWGEMVPVPENNIRVIGGGERLLGGAFEVAYTPGHASHHVSYLNDGIAFVGDAGGVRIGDGPTIPPGPPPDIDVEAWHRSIEAIAQWRPRCLARTHFGAGDDVELQLSELGQRLDAWAQRARRLEEEAFIESFSDEVTQASAPEFLPTYLQAAPPEQTYAGLRRYWKKRDEAVSTSEHPRVSSA
jgi:glyoxylase-like metal-dependent hydrolase (beta-lactamase superfamily II)